MSIREIRLDDSAYMPGENLSQTTGGYTHVIISYDISGDRHKVDNAIESAIEKDRALIKVDCVNTTLYWQVWLESLDEPGVDVNGTVKRVLKEKIQEIFVNKQDLSHEVATVFCMVGNIRGFAFEVDV
ncbi:hypothetical protein [Pectobacterium brasiliense]|uniref:hypothetical protein n=1 Tax=Pectobacterium brasiliense TaxID=180957 RepID=UPI0025A214ED|nr:hypothetical protein [Pectobacterium brasiliense]WJM80483.1 hypothetical protein QTI90_19805 [Pectobacterium brasiliense]